MSKPSAAQKLIGDIAPKLADLTDSVLFDDVWERKELSKRDRSLITVGQASRNGGRQIPRQIHRGGRPKILFEVRRRRHCPRGLIVHEESCSSFADLSCANNGRWHYREERPINRYATTHESERVVESCGLGGRSPLRVKISLPSARPVPLRAPMASPPGARLGTRLAAHWCAAHR